MIINGRSFKSVRNGDSKTLSTSVDSREFGSILSDSVDKFSSKLSRMNFFNIHLFFHIKISNLNQFWQ